MHIINIETLKVLKSNNRSITLHYVNITKSGHITGSLSNNGYASSKMNRRIEKKDVKSIEIKFSDRHQEIKQSVLNEFKTHHDNVIEVKQ